MDLTAWMNQLAAFVETNQVWAAPVIFVVAFAEGVIFLSILLPASVVLVVVGAMIARGLLDPWTIIIASSIGAALGDWSAYWLGQTMKGGAARIWPIRNNPELFHKGEAFVTRYGPMSIVFGKFIGPLRGVIPMCAGVFSMPPMTFHIANWSSSVLWSIVFLGGGWLGAKGVTMVPSGSWWPW